MITNNCPCFLKFCRNGRMVGTLILKKEEQWPMESSKKSVQDNHQRLISNNHASFVIMGAPFITPVNPSVQEKVLENP